MTMRWYDKLERKLGRFAIPNLMLYIVFLNLAVFIITYLTDLNLYFFLILDPASVMNGEIWRLFTYIFIPPETSHPLFMGFVLYLYYLIGNSLEHEWGTFKFNLFYFLGMLGTTLCAFITGLPVTPHYINLSLFLAFAKIYPDFELLLFFFLPVKVKYLAIINWFFFIISLILLPLPWKLAVAASLINYFAFFGKDIINTIKTNRKVKKNKQEFRSKLPKETTRHKCTVCGITEKDDPSMDFRYCTSCDGDYEYCMNHLKNHEHIKNV